MRNPSSSSSSSKGKSSAAALKSGGGAVSSSSSKTSCCIKVGLKLGPWTPEEDELLANYINKEGEGLWRTLPKHVGRLRCGKSCRLRWMNYLRPSVKQGQITADEEDLILRLHCLLGNRYESVNEARFRPASFTLPIWKLPFPPRFQNSIFSEAGNVMSSVIPCNVV